MNAPAGSIHSLPENPGPILAEQRRRKPRRVDFLYVLVACVVAGEAGLAAPFTSGNVSPLWPPAGVALAAFLLFGPRIWPAVGLAAFLVNAFTPVPYLAALGMAVANTAGPLCGALLLCRWRQFRPSIIRLRDVLALSFLGAFFGTALSATIGACVLLFTGVSSWSGFGSSWLVWWLGDALGVLIITPLVLTAIRLFYVREPRRQLELALLLTGAVASTIVIFDARLGLMRPDAFAFGVFPFVLWGAIQFETAGAAVVTFLISAIAAWGTAHGTGPFVRDNAIHNATLLQSFLGVTAISGMVLASVIAERAQLIREQSTREALERSEKIYRGIVETAYEGIWKVDANFVTSFVNGRMTELLGYTPEEMIGKPLFDFVFPSDIGPKWEDVKRRFRGARENLVTRYRKKDGSVLWARVVTSPVFGDDGTYEGALAMVSDLTEQKLAEMEGSRLRSRLSLLSRAVEQTADTVLITDSQGTIEYVNPAFKLTTGHSPEEAIGKTPKILKSNLHNKEFYGRLWERLLQGETYRGTLVNRKKTGELYLAEQTISPIKDTTGAITHFVSVFRDVTELRQRQEQQLELKMAREVQQRFYTGAAISVSGFEIATAAYPAHETGGDYLDMFRMADDRICIGIGDVSGHGLDSALVMALTRAYVRSFAQVESDLAKLLGRVNHMLVADRLENGRFATILLMCLNAANGSLAYASAGHVPGFLMSGSGEIVRKLESSGPALGLFDDASFETSELLLSPGHLVVLLTDGAAETTDPEDAEFGIDGVLDYVRRDRNCSAQELAQGIYGSARAFAADEPQHDDITNVIIKVA